MIRTGHLWLGLLAAFLLLPIRVCGEVMTATVTSYNAVEMSGDVPGEVWAAFDNENHSKGQVTEGKTATLTMGGWPNCTVSKVVIYLHSNKSGGAGTITLLVDEKIRFSVSGSMKDWVGAYSTETVPFALEGNWEILYNQTVRLMLTGTQNSIYIESIEVHYQIAPARPYCLTLNYSSRTRLETLEQCEDSIGAGIVLPAVEDLTDSTEQWVFAGWYPDEVFTSVEPQIYKAGTLFYPRHDDQLWAVYCNGNEQGAIPQCTERTDNEVVIVQRNDDLPDVHVPNYMMAGAVEENGVPAIEPIIDTTEDGTAYLTADYIPYSYRYIIQWRHHEEGIDSARIYHPFSQTYVGWSGTKLEANEKWWQVGYAGRSSFYFYHDENAQSQAYVLWESSVYDHYTETVAQLFTVLRIRTNTIQEGLLLFDVSELPTTSPVLYWSSNPYGLVGLQSVMPENGGARVTKCIRDGQIVIIRDDKTYTLTGLQIR